MKFKQPIIICGMHRSGTSLVSSLIESQGVFLGHKKQGDHEPVFFLHINEKIFKLLNASWDTPDNFKHANDFFHSNILKIIDKQLNSKDAVSYFGFLNYLKNHNFHKITYPWGWKDPRNTFTLEHWHKLFPKAKVIHVYRNPVDVANSLRSRQEKFMERFTANKNFEKYALKNDFLGTSYKCLYLNEGFNLWEKYVQKAFAANNEILHLKYEDLLSSPEIHIETMLHFIGIDKNTDRMEQFISRIDASRKHAFIGNEELERFYKSIQNKKSVIKLDYHHITL
ncbi:MAG: sulfotransferase [Bacteroidetes bacterium]|nr:sulfotransferase [Bacteroidota bacterium]